MSINKIFFSVVLILFFNPFYAQYGKLNLDVDLSNNSKRENYFLYLYKSDTLVCSKQIFQQDVWEIDSLAPRIYTLKIYASQGYNVIVYSNINVFNDSVTNLNLVIDETVLSTKKNKSVDEFEEINISLLYGNNNYLEESIANKHNESYTAAMGTSFQNPITKNNILSIYYGFSGGTTIFDKDTISYYGFKIKNKRYSYFCFDIGLYNRFTFYNCKVPYKSGFFIDLGINYSLPIYYREVNVLDYKTKIKTKFIHNYNDFHALARFGYKMFAITSEYNLTTFLKANYIETPKFRLGFTLCLSGSTL